MNRAKDILQMIGLIVVFVFLLYHLARVPKAHGQERVHYANCKSSHEHGWRCLPLDSAYAGELKFNSWQGLDSIRVFGWITDSVKWVPVDTTFEGDKCHDHEWVFSEEYKIADRIEGSSRLRSNGLLACISGHHGIYGKYAWQSHDYEEHCPYDVLQREKICRTCLRSVTERERWYQHYVARPKTEFQKLKEKQRAKP